MAIDIISIWWGEFWIAFLMGNLLLVFFAMHSSLAINLKRFFVHVENRMIHGYVRYPTVNSNLSFCNPFFLEMVQEINFNLHKLTKKNPSMILPFGKDTEKCLFCVAFSWFTMVKYSIARNFCMDLFDSKGFDFDNEDLTGSRVGGGWGLGNVFGIFSDESQKNRRFLCSV